MALLIAMINFFIILVFHCNPIMPKAMYALLHHDRLTIDYNKNIVVLAVKIHPLPPHFNHFYI